MCGIVGFAPVKENGAEILKQMMDRIAHRGPDGEGQFVDEYVALGHRRLSIIDLAGGTQPMATEPLVVVFNGEIYNSLKQILILRFFYMVMKNIIMKLLII